MKLKDLARSQRPESRRRSGAAPSRTCPARAAPPRRRPRRPPLRRSHRRAHSQVLGRGPRGGRADPRNGGPARPNRKTTDAAERQRLAAELRKKALRLAALLRARAAICSRRAISPAPSDPTPAPPAVKNPPYRANSGSIQVCSKLLEVAAFSKSAFQAASKPPPRRRLRPASRAPPRSRRSRAMAWQFACDETLVNSGSTW
jgi:hypothetical protein